MECPPSRVEKTSRENRVFRPKGTRGLGVGVGVILVVPEGYDVQ